MKKTILSVAGCFVLVGILVPIIIMSFISIRPAMQKTYTSSSTVESDVCPDVARAEAILEGMRQELLETYTEDYFESDFWVAFEKGYWEGFEETHQYCKRCY